MRLNLTPHPYVGINEKLFKRLEEKSWVYERTFYVDKLDQKFNYDLVLEGVDTLSQVYVNGEFAGKTEDMFIEYRFPIKEYLKEGENLFVLFPGREKIIQNIEGELSLKSMFNYL